MKSILLAIKANPFLFVFLSLGVRYVAVGAQLGDALAFLSLCGIFAMDKYIAWKKGPDVNEEVKRQLEQIKGYVAAISMKNGLKRDDQAPPGPGQRWF
jgi:hypothetical protein